MQKDSKCGRLLVVILSAALLVYNSRIDAGGCPGANNAYGTCSDTDATNDAGGPFYSWCGGCTNMTVTFVGGGCGGGGSGAFTCNQCTVIPKTVTQTFANSPVGSIQYALCQFGYVGCVGTGGAGCGALCVAACTPTAPAGPLVIPCFTGCMASCGAVGMGGCTCLFNMCANQCLPTAPPVPGTDALATCN